LPRVKRIEIEIKFQNIYTRLTQNTQLATNGMLPHQRAKIVEFSCAFPSQHEGSETRPRPAKCQDRAPSQTP
jgi:hypothetical protein